MPVCSFRPHPAVSLKAAVVEQTLKFWTSNPGSSRRALVPRHRFKVKAKFRATARRNINYDARTKRRRWQPPLPQQGD
jgi:hypothetical protein